MSTHEPQQQQGLAVRAIQEAHLSLQEAHRSYRLARDERGDDSSVASEKAEYQDAVLTFYELLRPYLKAENQLSAYWNGKIPAYPEQTYGTIEGAKQYYEDHGTGIYQMQQHVEYADVDQQVLADGGDDSRDLYQWHELLGRPKTSRLVSVQPDDNGYVYQELRFAVLGLRELDHWRATVTTERTNGDGFMAGETSTNRRREYEPGQRITLAKRMLTEAANKLGALPEYSIEDTRDARFDYSDLLDGDTDPEAQ